MPRCSMGDLNDFCSSPVGDVLLNTREAKQGENRNVFPKFSYKIQIIIESSIIDGLQNSSK